MDGLSWVWLGWEAEEELTNGRTYPGVWVFGEQNQDILCDVTFELTSKARFLADKLHAQVTVLVLGQQIDLPSEKLFSCGADRVLVGLDPILRDYQSDAYVPLIQGFVQRHKPEVFLFGATRVGLDLAPSLAARLQTGLSAHCIDLDINEEGRLVQVVPAFGSECVVYILCPNCLPQMATVKPGTFPVTQALPRQGEVVHVHLVPPHNTVRTKIIEYGSTPLTDGSQRELSPVVVGGAGIGSSEGWQLVEQLARCLGGRVGATRPAVDEGWATMKEMIGHSGRSVRSELYIGIGVSGDMLHMIGTKNARVAVAINKDPHAPIFHQVDYGIVGDYRVVVPALLRELENIRAGS